MKQEKSWTSFKHGLSTVRTNVVSWPLPTNGESYSEKLFLTMTGRGVSNPN